MSIETFDEDIDVEEIVKTKKTTKKSAVKAKNKSNKGDKMGKNSKAKAKVEEVEVEMVEAEMVEVEVDESGIPVESIADLKKEMFSISEVASETLGEISEEIQLADVDKIDAVEKLKAFVLKQEELSKPYGLTQRATALLTRLPLIGAKMEETYKDMKADHLESQTVKEIIYKVYDDMVANGEKIEKRVIKFNELRKELMVSIEKTIELREKVIVAIKYSEEDSIEIFELEKLQLSLNGQISEFNEEIRNLKQIEVVTRGIAMQITESTPANKDRLLRKIASFSTIADANNQLNAFKELRDLTTSLDESIQNAIFDTVENVLEGEQQSKKVPFLMQSETSCVKNI